jgi:hypothetical protein
MKIIKSFSKKIVILIFIIISFLFLSPNSVVEDFDAGISAATNLSWAGEGLLRGTATSSPGNFLDPLKKIDQVNWTANHKDYRYFSDYLVNKAGTYIGGGSPVNTANTFYVIEDAIDLFNLSKGCSVYLNGTTNANIMLGLKYVLGNNIEYREATNQSKYFYPIGNLQSYPFRGSFDGQGFEISNLQLDPILSDTQVSQFYMGDLAYYSMFSRVSAAGIVQNFGLFNYNIVQSAEVGNMHYVTTFVGENRGNLNHVYWIDDREDDGFGGGPGIAADGGFFVVSGLFSQNFGTVNNAFVATGRITNSSTTAAQTYVIGAINSGTVSTDTIFYDNTILASSTTTNYKQFGTAKTTSDFESRTSFNQTLFTNWFFDNGSTTTISSSNLSYQYSKTYPRLLGLEFVSTSEFRINTPMQLVHFQLAFDEITALKQNTTIISFVIMKDLDMKQVGRNAYNGPATAFKHRLVGVQTYFQAANSTSWLYTRSTASALVENVNGGGFNGYPTIFNLNLEKPVVVGNVIGYGLIPHFVTNGYTVGVDYLNFINAKVNVNELSLSGISEIAVGVAVGNVISQANVTNNNTFSYLAVDCEVNIYSTLLPQKISVGGIIGNAMSSTILYLYGQGYVDFHGNRAVINSSTPSSVAGGGLIGRLSKNGSGAYGCKLNFCYSAVNVSGMAFTSNVNKSTVAFGGVAGRGSMIDNQAGYVYSVATVDAFPAGGMAHYVDVAGTIGRYENYGIQHDHYIGYFSSQGEVIVTLPPSGFNLKTEIKIAGVMNTGIDVYTYNYTTNWGLGYQNSTNRSTLRVRYNDGTFDRSHNNYTEGELDRIFGEMAGVINFSYGLRPSYRESSAIYNFSDLSADLSIFNVVSGVAICNDFYYTDTVTGSIVCTPVYGTNNFSGYYPLSSGTKWQNMGNIELTSFNSLTDDYYLVAGVAVGFQLANNGTEMINTGDIVVNVNHKASKKYDTSPLDYSGAVNWFKDTTATNRKKIFSIGGVESHLKMYSATSSYFNYGNIAFKQNYVPTSNANDVIYDLYVGGIAGIASAYSGALNSNVSLPSTFNTLTYSIAGVNNGNIYVKSNHFGNTSVGGILGNAGNITAAGLTSGYITINEAMNTGDIYVENNVRQRPTTAGDYFVSTPSANANLSTFGITVGGIVGSLNGDITSAKISNAINTGNIAAFNSNTVSYYSVGNLHLEQGICAGGIIGKSYGGTAVYGSIGYNVYNGRKLLISCINYGNVYANTNTIISSANYATHLGVSAGGILGSGLMSIWVSSNYGSIYSKYMSGGIIGELTLNSSAAALTQGTPTATDLNAYGLAGVVNYGVVGYLSSASVINVVQTYTNSYTINSVTGMTTTKPTSPDYYVHAVGGILGKISLDATSMQGGYWPLYYSGITSIRSFYYTHLINLNPGQNAIGLVAPVDPALLLSKTYFGINGKLNKYNATVNPTDTTGNGGSANPFYFKYYAPTEASGALFDPAGIFRVKQNPNDLEENLAVTFVYDYLKYVPLASIPTASTKIRSTLTTSNPTATGIFGVTSNISTTYGPEYYINNVFIVGTDAAYKYAYRTVATTDAYTAYTTVNLYNTSKTPSNKTLQSEYTSVIQVANFTNPAAALTLPTGITVRSQFSTTNITSSRRVESPHTITSGPNAGITVAGYYEFEIKEGSPEAGETIGARGVERHDGYHSVTYVTIEEAIAMGVEPAYKNVPRGEYVSTTNPSPLNGYVVNLGNYMIDPLGSGFIECGPFDIEGIYNVGTFSNLNFSNSANVNSYRGQYANTIVVAPGITPLFPILTTGGSAIIYEYGGVSANGANGSVTVNSWASTDSTFGMYKFESGHYAYAGPNREQTYMKIVVDNGSPASITVFDEPTGFNINTPSTEINSGAVYTYYTYTGTNVGYTIASTIAGLQTKASLLRSYGPYANRKVIVDDYPGSIGSPYILDDEDLHDGLIRFTVNATGQVIYYQLRMRRIPSASFTDISYTLNTTTYTGQTFLNVYGNPDTAAPQTFYTNPYRVRANFQNTPSYDLDIKNFYIKPIVDKPSGFDEGDFIMTDPANPYKHMVEFSNYNVTYGNLLSFAYITDNLSSADLTYILTNQRILYVERDSSGNEITKATNIIKQAGTTAYTGFIMGAGSIAYFGILTKQDRPDPLFGTWGPGVFFMNLAFNNYAWPSGEYRIETTLPNGTIYNLYFFRNFNKYSGFNPYYSIVNSGNSLSYYTTNSIGLPGNVAMNITVPYGSFYEQGASGSSPLLNFTKLDELKSTIGTNKTSNGIGIPVESYFYNNYHMTDPNRFSTQINIATLGGNYSLLPMFVDPGTYNYGFGLYSYLYDVNFNYQTTQTAYPYYQDSNGDTIQDFYIRHTYIVTYSFISAYDIDRVSRGLTTYAQNLRVITFTITEAAPALTINTFTKDYNNDINEVNSVNTDYGHNNVASFPKNEIHTFEVNYTAIGTSYLNNNISHPLTPYVMYGASNLYSSNNTGMLFTYSYADNLAYSFTGYSVAFPKKAWPGDYYIYFRYEGHPWTISYNGVTNNVNSTFDFRAITFVKAANRNSRLEKISFSTDFPLLTGFNVIAKWKSLVPAGIPLDSPKANGSISETEYVYWIDNPNTRPMNINPQDGINYSNAPSMNDEKDFYLIGQVQRTVISSYTPQFKLPDGAYIARIVNEGTIYDPYSQQTEYAWEYDSVNESYSFTSVKNPLFKTNFAIEPVSPNDFYYIHYRVYSEAYMYDNFGNNNGFYTDFYISVQDATNNVYFLLTVITEGLDLSHRLGLPKAFITFYAYDSTNANHPLMLEMSTFAQFNLNGAGTDRETVAENLQFRNVMAGDYVVVLDLSPQYDFELRSSHPSIVINADKKSFFIPPGIVIRRYALTIVIKQTNQILDWGQFGSFTYIP